MTSSIFIPKKLRSHLDIVKQNEVDEFKSSFPQAADLIDKMLGKYLNLLEFLNLALKEIVYPKNISPQEKKKFAENVFTTLKKFNLNSNLSPLFFLLHEGKIENIEDYIQKYPNQKLYKLL